MFPRCPMLYRLPFFEEVDTCFLFTAAVNKKYVSISKKEEGGITSLFYLSSKYSFTTTDPIFIVIY